MHTILTQAKKHTNAICFIYYNLMARITSNKTKKGHKDDFPPKRVRTPELIINFLHRVRLCCVILFHYADSVAFHCSVRER